MAITTIDNFSFDTLDSVKVFQNGVFLGEAEEPTDVKIEFTGDPKEIKGANGKRIRMTTINRGVKISGNNAVLSGGLLAMTFDAKESTSNVTVKYKASVTVTAAGGTANKITLPKTPTGTAGAEVNVAWVTTPTGVVTELTQATVAAGGKFSISGAEMTFTPGAIAAGDVVTCYYDTVLTAGLGTKIINDLSKTSTPVVDIVVEGMGSKACNASTQSFYQFQGYQMQANMVWSIDIGDSQTKQPFEFSSSVGKCNKNTVGATLTVYDEED